MMHIIKLAAFAILGGLVGVAVAAGLMTAMFYLMFGGPLEVLCTIFVISAIAAVAYFYTKQTSGP